jgi:hypothetical protein
MPDERRADPPDEIVVLQAAATLFTNGAFCKKLWWCALAVAGAPACRQRGVQAAKCKE